MYTNERYVEDNMKDIISNYKDGVRRTCSIWKLFSLMTQCSRYKMAPLGAKNYYIYDTSDIKLLVECDIIVNIENDVPLYRRLTEDGLKISENDSEGTYRFIHMHGAHPPYTMTEDFQYVEYDYRRDGGYNVPGVSQWKGALKIVYEYIRQLKELGKYEDALIIITADHGITSDISDSEGNMLEASYPILFVKQPYESHEKMLVSDAPVCHTDVISTIKKKIGIVTSDRALEEIGSNENRKRYMINSDFMKTYEIDGDVRLIENWRLISRE